MPKTTTTEAKFKAAKAKSDVAAYKAYLRTRGSCSRAMAQSSGVLIGNDLATA
jgi:hypothetical protein